MLVSMPHSLLPDLPTFHHIHFPSHTSGHAQGYFHLPDSTQRHWAVPEHLRLPHRSSKYSPRPMRGVHPSGETARGQVLPCRSSDDTKHTVLSNPHCLAASGKYFYWKPVRIFWKYTLFWGFVIEIKGQKNSSGTDRRKCMMVHGEFAQNHSPPSWQNLEEHSQLRTHLNCNTSGAAPRTVFLPAQASSRVKTWSCSRADGKPGNWSAIAGAAGSLRAAPLSTRPVVLFPLPHTKQCSHNVMRAWHEIKLSFIRMMEILHSFCGW